MAVPIEFFCHTPIPFLRGSVSYEEIVRNSYDSRTAGTKSLRKSYASFYMILFTSLSGSDALKFVVIILKKLPQSSFLVCLMTS